MKLKYLFCIFSFIILRGISFSQDNQVSNINAVDNLLDESLVPFSNKLVLLGEGKFYNIITDGNKEQHLFLIESIKRKFSKYKILVNEDSGNIDYIVSIKNPVIKIKYNNLFSDRLLGTKKVAREVSISYDLELIDQKNSSSLYLNNFNKKVIDSFELDKLNIVEDHRYKFSRSALPEENTLNKLLFPVLIIATSAAAIILFFIIRSK
ncbi:MAG: hypothetical protein ABIY50_13890 [Ignavibacteria bacterium]